MLTPTTSPSNGQPSVLVVGYDPDSAMRMQYDKRVLFREPHQVLTPADIPTTVRRVIVSNRTVENEKRHADRLTNLAKSRSATYEIKGGGLATLREFLEDSFPKFVADPVQRPPLPPATLVPDVSGADDDVDEEVSLREKLQAVQCKSGSISAFLRDKIQTTDAMGEARRLINLVNSEFPDRQRRVESIYGLIRNLLLKADVVDVGGKVVEPPRLEEELGFIATETKLIEGLQADNASLKAENAQLRDQLDASQKEASSIQGTLDGMRRLLAVAAPAKT